jgi:acetyl-CoA carboxylase biotin carboxyl carrier protein
MTTKPPSKTKNLKDVFKRVTDSAPAAPTPARGAKDKPEVPFSVDVIRALAQIVEQHGLAELKLALGDGTLELRRGAWAASAQPHAAPAPVVHQHASPAAHVVPAVVHASASSPTAESHAAPSPAPAAAPAASATGPNGAYATVNSPFVGTFYRSPSPDAPSFVEVGQRVKKGQVMCIVEAMKLMNEIEAEVDGTVSAILVENAQPVEYGQPLFRVSPGN